MPGAALSDYVPDEGGNHGPSEVISSVRVALQGLLQKAHLIELIERDAVEGVAYARGVASDGSGLICLERVEQETQQLPKGRWRR